MTKDHKTVSIVVEGTHHQWPKGQITYAEVVALEVASYSSTSGISYAVKFTRSNVNKHWEILSPGASVEVKEGMIFNVSETGQS